ncbi:ATP-binding protein [Fulvimonas sp. R45]|uniref:hybrid sensor histidine kinase/response regulator n=1 Tax=Fulvimonas sp. R45 TaxID=3045937 RepID=UPI00265F94AC|nr:hybrid sensor histidine kinase/response regulator [Fulvimonas sp. R45]MDO1528174.1 ATP-binding protein [Fulvimonas sp. R45]
MPPTFALSAVLAAAFAWVPAHAALAAADASAAPVAAPAAMLPTPQFRHYGEADGVPAGAVYAIAQDHAGAMWFGTAEGLVRYDGVGFKVFHHEPDDPASLPADQTYALYVDRGDRIWAGGVTSGLILYDQRSRRFRQWTHDAKNPASLSGDEVWSIAQTPDGAVWVATQHGLDRLRPDLAGFDHVALPGEGNGTGGAVRALLADADGHLWIGAGSGLFVRDPDGRIRAVPVAGAFHGDLGKVWRIQGRAGEIRVAVQDGLLVIGRDGVARPFDDARLSQLHASVTSSARDAQGRLWVAGTKGLLLDDGAGSLRTVVSHPLLRGGLPSDRIWQVTRDGEGGLWFALDQSGIAYLPPDWNSFTRFTHIPDDPDSLTGISALTVERSRDGKLLVGGFDGWLDKLDVDTGTVEHLSRALHGNITAIAEDARGRLWITESGAVFELDGGKARALDIARAHVTRPVFVRAGGDGRIYVASWGEGIFAIDPDSLAITPVPLPQGVDNVAIADQLSVHDGTLWYASGGGLLRLDPGSGRMAMVPGVPHAEVTAVAFDQGGFWASSQQALSHYRLVDGKAVRDGTVDISHQPFLPNLMSMRVDGGGNVWLFANPGLWRMDARTHRFENFGTAQGLSNTDFTNGSVAMFPDGTLFAANGGGVVAFRPGALSRPRVAAPQPLMLSRLSVNRGGRVQELDDPRGQAPVRIGWRDRDLRVQARLASYVDPSANDYRFRLHGLDADWVDVGSHGEREFAGLPAGDYTLDVEAAGAGGTWSRLAAPLRIHVQAPPWLRWWAWLAYLVLAALLAWAVLLAWRRRLAHRHRIQLAEQQRSLAEQASAAKSQFLATLSHEIRTPMTGVMGMAELLLGTEQTPRQREYTEAMQRSGSLLLKLVNDALDLARIEVGKLVLEPTPFDPRALAWDVARLEQAQAQAKGLALDLQLDESLPARLLGDALRIKQVLFNLVNNALKFTERGGVTLGLRWQGDALMCTVSDTGPGIPEENQARLFERFEQDDGPQRRSGSGLGLAICRELVALMHGTIALRSRPGHGSSFSVRLPLPMAAGGAVSAPAGPAAPATGGDALDVLLVEDDAIVAAVIRGLLEQQGHRVRYAANGLQALAELAQGPCDAVLLDLDLPGVDGLQVARLIRQGEAGRGRVWIVAITARSGGDEEARSRTAGMDGFLRKPLTGAQLAEALAVVSRARAAVEADPA